MPFRNNVKGHKYFQFRPFPDQTNDIFLKISTKPTLGPFLGIFHKMRNFLKSMVPSLLSIYGALT